MKTKHPIAFAEVAVTLRAGDLERGDVASPSKPWASSRARWWGSAVAMMGCLLAMPAAAGVLNGGFEANPPGLAGPGNAGGWVEMGGAVANPPGNPPPGGPPGNGAQLGPSAGAVRPRGARVCLIGQPFDCGTTSSSNEMCSISFDYQMVLPAGAGAPVSQARVILSGGWGLRGAVLPPSPAYRRVRVNYPRCGLLTLMFHLEQVPPAGFMQATFNVDNVTSECGTLFFLGGPDELRLLPADQMPGLQEAANDLAALDTIGPVPVVANGNRPARTWLLVAAAGLFVLGLVLGRLRRTPAP